MNTNYLIFLSAALLWVGGCKSSEITLTGKIDGKEKSKIYLCRVDNEYYRRHTPIDSTEVIDGKFSFSMNEVSYQQLFIGTNPNRGGYLFFDGTSIKIIPERMDQDEIVWQVDGSVSDVRYRQYLSQLREVSKQHILDSLDQLFFEARAIEDTARMRAIKEESMPYYDRASQEERKLVKQTLAEEPTSLFKLYLYYNKEFLRKDFSLKEEIEKERLALKQYAGPLEQVVYRKAMEARLNQFEHCAIGSQAPEIWGVDTLGNEIRLSDFRGKYVIVDFWNSYCKWCRLETPYLQSALNRFQGKEVTVLGVSSDYLKDAWMTAIHEDKSYWDHLLIDRANIDSILNSYCINGIPHIVLVDPEGVILCKDMRHEEIATSLARYLD